jgi:beta-mannosidase
MTKMLTIDLNGPWQMKRTDDTQWIDARVPGSVYADLLRAERMEDPFYRDNEDKALALSYFDYEYTRNFDVDDKVLSQDKVLLRCEGLDTLAEININGHTLAHTDNMHRTYEFDVKGLLQEGHNVLRIVFASPSRYITEKHAENPIWGDANSMPGISHLRKGHSMFGWDWGPKLPDAGIWRNISIVAYSDARLDDVHIQQQHEQGLAKVSVDVSAQVWSNNAVQASLLVLGTDGKTIVYENEQTLSKETPGSRFDIDILSPELWWPNGYGKQPLYTVKVGLFHEGQTIEEKSYTIGLRTLGLKREKDEWGESFAIEVNGVAIFAQGANYIPEDNILSRNSKERTETLIRNCVEANFNCIRVWGGGVYPNDDFFDLCDRYGLVVWQDFMFACAIYEMNDAFADNIRQEAIDNVRRIRHHASLGLWCGNNEMEEAWVTWGIPKTPKLRTDYLKQFEVLLVDVVRKYDPQRDYWPSSPSSGGSFDEPNDENRGDVHYWQVWHGLKPFTDYRKFYFRFCSEFGFQSFPSMKTVSSFTLPEDRNIFSYVMEKHQKNNGANGKILYYLSEHFKYPKDFESMLFASQILQAEAIKYGVEHWRRHRGRCMGSIYWQLNDCWPVASWSSIDNFGRWKALHYFAKRFHAPVLLSACEEGTSVQLHVTNETMSKVSGVIHWRLRDSSSRILEEGRTEAAIEALQAKLCVELDFAEELKDGAALRQTYLEFALLVDGVEVSGSTVLFTRAKHFDFLDPQLRVELQETEQSFELIVHADAFAKYVGLELRAADGIFSDNFFDVSAGDPKIVLLDKSRLSAPLTLEQLKEQLQVTSLFDLA